jgi:hypothetical protein
VSETNDFIPVLPTEEAAAAKSRSWLLQGHRLDSMDTHGHETHPWWKVLWLTGVDYFSTLGYQPGIALLAAGAISPVATTILVLVTLFCAVPIYAQVAKRSYVGQGSIAMLENLLEGWYGRLLVLVLLGFASTDFVITMTLSAADASKHAIENPFLHDYLGDHQIAITLVLLALLAGVFLQGFSEAIGFAAVVAIPYILLNVIVLGRCLMEIASRPELIANWRMQLTGAGDWTGLALASAIIFPKLALGLSGFETGVSVMPLIKGNAKDDHSERPEGRIRNTRKLLVSAAIIMSVLLMVSSFATTLLIEPRFYEEGGKASGRAIAYLAHLYMGEVFGTIYDLSTILILWFAGSSAMAGLLHLIPRYLPRLGMAPHWVAYPRPLIVVLFAITVIVTLIFRADVEAQGGAYAISNWSEGLRRIAIYCGLVALVFGYTLITNVIERPDGIIIASVFIFVILTVSGISRYFRATELRVATITFVDEASAELWREITGKKVCLVPLRTPTFESVSKKDKQIRQHYKTDGPFAYLHVRLLDNRSEFFAPLRIRVTKADGFYIIDVAQAIAIANTIAYISELVDPMSIFLTLTRRNLMGQALRFILLGEGETALLVYTILLRYWEWTPEDDVRPFIYLMSD